LAFFLATACHHTKKITKTTTTSKAQIPTTPSLKETSTIVDEKAQALLMHLKKNELQFTELAIKLKTKVTSPELNQSFTTNIRWKKNEKIWLSMSIIGIEGVRVLITKDSIKIMDKINSRYVLKPLSYISQKALVDLSFSDIQNLLLGQLIFTDSSKAIYTENANNITISANGTRFLTNILFDRSTKNLNYLYINDKTYSQTIDVQYSDYQIQLGKPFPMERTLNMKKGMGFFEMIAKIQNLEVKQNLEFPFTINPSYKIE
jgi:hypothetical protein